MKNKGFTLIEVMITMVVVSVAILMTLAGNSKIQLATEGAFERTLALQDNNQVLEQMRNDARALSDFPKDIVDTYEEGCRVVNPPPPARKKFYFSDQLVNQEVAVFYEDTTADPLDVTVMVCWLRNGTPKESGSDNTKLCKEEPKPCVSKNYTVCGSATASVCLRTLITKRP